VDDVFQILEIPTFVYSTKILKFG